MIERWKIAVISSGIMVALASWFSSALSLLPAVIRLDRSLQNTIQVDSFV